MGPSGPMVASDHGNSVTRIFVEKSFFGSFLCFELFVICDFSKIWFSGHEILWSLTTSQIRHRNHPFFIGHFEIANPPTKKYRPSCTKRMVLRAPTKWLVLLLVQEWLKDREFSPLRKAEASVIAYKVERDKGNGFSKVLLCLDTLWLSY